MGSSIQWRIRSKGARGPSYSPHLFIERVNSPTRDTGERFPSKRRPGRRLWWVANKRARAVSSSSVTGLTSPHALRSIRVLVAIRPRIGHIICVLVAEPLGSIWRWKGPRVASWVTYYATCSRTVPRGTPSQSPVDSLVRTWLYACCSDVCILLLPHVYPGHSHIARVLYSNLPKLI